MEKGEMIMVRPSLLPLEKGGTLGMGELLNICRCLEIAGVTIAIGSMKNVEPVELWS